MVRRHALCRSVKNMYDITAENPVIPDKFSIPEAMNFAWSLPISTLITGAENKEFLEEKIMLSKNFAILDTDEKTRIIESVSDLSIYGKLAFIRTFFGVARMGVMDRVWRKSAW